MGLNSASGYWCPAELRICKDITLISFTLHLDIGAQHTFGMRRRVHRHWHRHRHGHQQTRGKHGELWTYVGASPGHGILRTLGMRSQLGVWWWIQAMTGCRSGISTGSTSAFSTSTTMYTTTMHTETRAHWMESMPSGMFMNHCRPGTYVSITCAHIRWGR